MVISICCPTRKRPNQMSRLWNSMINTAYSLSNIELIFYIDNDDQDSIQKYEQMRSDQIRVVIGERILLSQMWNECQKMARGEIFMVCADDIVFVSEDWDRLIVEEFFKFPDRIILAHGMDGGKNERLGTHPFLHKNWVDVVGYFTPPYFSFQL